MRPTCCVHVRVELIHLLFDEAILPTAKCLRFDKMSIGPEQCRAARGFLAWSQEDLASASGVSRATLIDFERGERQPIASNLKMIQAALERAGIEFTRSPDDRVGVIGPKSTAAVAKRAGPAARKRSS
jgi:DNA-binding XRE family transcriptional regulator